MERVKEIGGFIFVLGTYVGAWVFSCSVLSGRIPGSIFYVGDQQVSPNDSHAVGDAMVVLFVGFHLVTVGQYLYDKYHSR